MTSAAQLTLIIDELLASKCLDQAQAFSLLESKGLLPTKLKLKPLKPSKPISRFASQAAEDAAEAEGFSAEELRFFEGDFTGSSKDGKITLKDVKDLAKKNEVKVNASPAAKAFASANGLDVGDFKGSGPDGKVLMSDLLSLGRSSAGPKTKAKAKAKKETPAFKLSSGAKKLVEKWQIDEDDLKEITGTGTGGSIKQGDLKELIAAAKEAWEEESDSGSESEEDLAAIEE